MKAWATERRAMAEENEMLRRLLAEAEGRIRQLELIALTKVGDSNMKSSEFDVSQCSDMGRGGNCSSVNKTNSSAS
eukprot:9981565-Ditylum_brightwellii.AAC.1